MSARRGLTHLADAALVPKQARGEQVARESWRQVASDNEHRTQHWVQLIAIANSSGANDAKIARLEKEVEELKSAVHRSPSARMRPRQQALPQP